MTEIATLRSVETAPHSVEAEQQILGAMLNNNTLYDKVARVLTREHFHDPLHGDIFDLVAEMVEAGDLASPVTLKERMSGNEGMKQIGGPAYLARLSAGAMASSMVLDYAALLSELKAKRDILAAMRVAQDAIPDGKSAEIAAALEGALAAAVLHQDRSGPISMLTAVTDAIRDVQAAMETGVLPGVRSGLSELERLCPIFGPGELILLGGRPSMGKTGVALSIATAAARAGHGVVIVSLEMLPKALALRAVSEATAHSKRAVSYSKMAQGDVPEITRESMLDAARHVARLPIQFLSRDYSTIGAMTAGVREARKLLPQGKCPLVVVDYAQLLKSPAKSRYEQITEISIALKGMAMRLECPVLALSQLSRALEQRDDKRPQLSDLRESGQLEQDADTVLFCYRDEYYLEREKPDDIDEDGMEKWRGAMERARNRLEMIVAKQRQGAVGIAHMRFNPALNLIWSDRA